MLDTAILKSLLQYEFYEQNKGRLNRKLFSDEIRSLYQTLVTAHETFQHDLTSKELYKIWEVENPVSTRAEKADIEDVLSLIDLEEEYSTDIAGDVTSSERRWKEASYDCARSVGGKSSRHAEGSRDL